MSHAEIREEVRKLCRGYPGEYWRTLDRERAYPADFVAELTRAGFDPVEYFELRDARTLAPAAAAPARLFAAAHLAGVRLIDNVAVG